MQTTTTQDSSILLKTRELCQAILDQPETRSALQRIETFLADQSARARYEDLMSKGQVLNQKQQRSIPLTDEEVSSFEQEREALLNNPVARGFLDAQEELHAMQQSITKYVTKTLELGRVASEEDFDSCGCGSSCGCGH
jgi:cell fate (sporulation/competence/biofilm development) regulator YlbF (YheA/YmcA/DUF963 family)